MSRKGKSMSRADQSAKRASADNASHPQTRPERHQTRNQPASLPSGARNDTTMSSPFTTTEYDPADHRPAPRRYAWSVFAILFALMVVDYVDRQVVVSMFPHLKAQWDLSDGQLGALVSIVSITVALGAVPLSLLADRWSRVKSIFLMALVWSLATIACAFAGSYAQLLGARSVVGLGEAAYGTVGAALLASLFPPRMRSTVLGAFLARRHAGLGAGRRARRRSSPSAGAGRRVSARSAFPGSFLAVVFLLVVRDYKTVALPAAGGKRQPKPRMTARAIVAELLRPRTALVDLHRRRIAAPRRCRRSTRGCRATSTATTASRRTRRDSRPGSSCWSAASARCSGASLPIA